MNQSAFLYAVILLQRGPVVSQYLHDENSPILAKNL